MSDKGTIDVAGFRADLKDISQNDYPIMQLLQLPLDIAAGTIFRVPLGAPGNNLVLTYQAINQQGNLMTSAPAPGSIDTSAPAALPQGFARFNENGPWIPLSMFGPLMKGLVTPYATYDGNPILGAGFSSIQMPIQVMEWQVLASQQQSGYILAFFGLNFGLGSTIGNGTSTTMAIPSAAGPIARMVAARCLP
jgi:hypothetical protein